MMTKQPAEFHTAYKERGYLGSQVLLKVKEKKSLPFLHGFVIDLSITP